MTCPNETRLLIGMSDVLYEDNYEEPMMEKQGARNV